MATRSATGSSPRAWPGDDVAARHSPCRCGAAVGLVAGLGSWPRSASAAAWAGRVAARHPARREAGHRIDPFALQEPWRASCRARSRRRPASTGRSRRARRVRCATTSPTSAPALETASRSAGRSPARATKWTAGSRRSTCAARRPSSTGSTRSRPARTPRPRARRWPRSWPRPARMKAVSTDARDRLRLLDARLDELVARAVELSVSGSDIRDLRARRRRRQPRHRDGVAPPGARGGEPGRRRGRGRLAPGVAEPVTDGGRSDQQRLLAANLSVALGTLLSRVTGLLRVGVFGFVIGQNALADAYNGANNTPNSVYELLIGGVLSATLVPVFTAQLEDDDEEATSAVITVAVIAMAAVDGGRRRRRAADLPPVLPAPSAASTPSSTGRWARPWRDLPAPDLLLRAHGTRLPLLHARRRFFAPAWAPVLANLVIIGVLADGAERPARARSRRSTWPTPTPGSAAARPRHHVRHRRHGGRRCCPRSCRAGVHLRFRPTGATRPCARSLTLSGWTSATSPPTRSP